MFFFKRRNRNIYICQIHYKRERNIKDNSLLITMFITFFYQINGLYDIACALSILGVINSPYLRSFHLNLFKEEPTEESKRFIGYWILTYGVIRFFSNDHGIIRLTYFIEFICLFNEFIHNSLFAHLAIFTCLASLWPLIA